MAIHRDDSLENKILNRIFWDEVLSLLTDEEREIMELRLVEEKSFDEIGVIIGMKYRNRVLTGSNMRYHRDKIRHKLKTLVNRDSL
jgi:DNA-directed RNA polymerase specialized sigma subunit